MDMGIAGRLALVTGASRGLGRNIAECLAQEGARVALVARTRSEIDEFVDQHGPDHVAIECDLMEEGAPTEMLRKLEADFGMPSIVVHNVGGTMDVKEPFCGLENWRKIYRFNLEIAVELNEVIIPRMRESGWGRIVHISSISGLENQGPVPYCSFKAALNAYTRSMGRLVSPDGINISAVLPGAVFTTGGYWDYTSQNNPAHVEKYLKERMAIRRFGTLDEIGKVVTFLCSEHASFIVGSSVLVDGGQGRCFM